MILKEAGEGEQRAAGNIHEKAQGMREDVFEPRPPEIRPDGVKGGDDVFDYEQSIVFGQLGEGIETDRPGKMSWIEVDEIIGARGR